jgi:hypothetical protein
MRRVAEWFERLVRDTLRLPKTPEDFRFWPIASFRVSRQLDRFGCEIGFGGSRDLRRSATSGSSRNIGGLPGGPRENRCVASR